MTKTSVSRSCEVLRGMGETQVSAVLSDRIARAFLLDGAAREMALDANARLFTELREQRVWPSRPVEPESDGA